MKITAQEDFPRVRETTLCFVLRFEILDLLIEKFIKLEKKLSS